MACFHWNTSSFAGTSCAVLSQEIGVPSISPLAESSIISPWRESLAFQKSIWECLPRFPSAIFGRWGRRFPVHTLLPSYSDRSFSTFPPPTSNSRILRRYLSSISFRSQIPQMADELIINGMESTGHPTPFELSRKDQYLGEQDAEALDPKRKIEALEEEKFELVYKNEEQNQKIMLLMERIEEFKNNQAEMEKQLQSLQQENVCFEENKKMLKMVTARVEDLENEINCLQRELGASMAQCEVAAETLQRMKTSFEKVEKSNRERVLKIQSLEEENAFLNGQIERLTAETELEIRKLQQEANTEVLEAELLVKEMEIRRLKKYLDESKAKKSEMEGKMEKLEPEKVLKGEGREYRCNKWRGLKLPWPLAASAGTVAAAAMIYLKCAQQRSS